MRLFNSRIRRNWGVGVIGACLSMFVGLCSLMPPLGRSLAHLSYDLASSALTSP
jgi:hypothetical protein